MIPTIKLPLTLTDERGTEYHVKDCEVEVLAVYYSTDKMRIRYKNYSSVPNTQNPRRYEIEIAVKDVELTKSALKQLCSQWTTVFV